MEALSTAADNVAGISDIDIKVDLVHLQTYIFRIQYQDVLRNAPATDFTGTMTFDVVTATPTIHYPVADGTFREGFTLDFTIPEEAQAGTVLLTVTPSGRIAPGGDHPCDFGGPRRAPATLALTTLAPRPTYADGHRYTITMQDLASVATARSEVDTVSVANAGQAATLLHLNSYNLVLSLKDTADNVAATFTVSNATFDLFTIAPVMTAPETGDYIVTDFVVDFSLLELAEGWVGHAHRIVRCKHPGQGRSRRHGSTRHYVFVRRCLSPPGLLADLGAAEHARKHGVHVHV